MKQPIKIQSNSTWIVVDSKTGVCLVNNDSMTWSKAEKLQSKGGK